MAAFGYLLGFTALLGHHYFWRAHADLADVVVAGLVIFGAFQIGINVLPLIRRSSALRSEHPVPRA